MHEFAYQVNLLSDPAVEELSEEMDHVFIGEVNDVTNSVWTKHIIVEGLDKPVQFKLDTGTDVSVIPRKFCKHVKL